MQQFAGRVAVVTGAASGIGFALASRFGREGMRVVMADIEQPALETAVQRLTDAGHEVLGVPTDVSKLESVQALADQTLERFGAVHILCNNAGVGAGFGKVWEASLNDWQWALGVNLYGVIHGVHTFLPLMLERGDEGHVVNTASIAGLVPGNRVYSVTKHAVVALSEAVYHNLAQMQSRVHVSVLCPGLINTRIMYAFRNRPGVPVASFEMQRADRISDMAMSRGLPPESVAERVREAIVTEQFWILTHDHFDDTIRTRSEDILNRRNPEPYRSELDLGASGV
jgi:NAD(P)-dependent dehydrogenase (short-subunit alcohol dehydrogenase family)